jgi:hypothetical protein
MMLKKIISGGQTGADRAALDAAIRWNIPHGGWVPKGRLAEDGPLSQKYLMEEMPTDSYAARTEQNVIDSDGTLIVASGKLTGGTDLTRELALKHRKQLLGIDLTINDHAGAASLIVSWIRLRRIVVLNVAGPRASEEPGIYDHVRQILDLTIKSLRNPVSEARSLPGRSAPPGRPQTVAEAVDRLIADMPLKDRTILAKMEERDLDRLRPSLGISIRNQFLYPRNDVLLESCRQAARDKYLHWDQAPAVIIRKLWQKLQETHRLRVVK